MSFNRLIYDCKSWAELDKKLSKLTHSNKDAEAGEIFAIVVKLFFQTDPVYRTKISNVWLEKDVPTKLRNKINLPPTDEGIDLILETKEKKVWSVQAKYRSDPDAMLKFTGEKSLSTFTSLSFFTCNEISHGLVCATINKPPKKIHLLPKKKNKTVGFILRDIWDGLDDDIGWKMIREKAKGRIIKPIKKKKKKFQKIAVSKTINHFKNNNRRGKLIMPCGTGKSLLGFWIAKELNSKRIIVAVPSLALISQTLKVWTTEYLINNIYPDWLCVCSDQTVTKDQDEFISFTHDLGIETTTDINQIHNFLNNKNGKIKIIFTTYQSGKALSLASKKVDYDLAIFDEAHKTVGNEDKLMGHLLKDTSINIKRRLFMTATERLYHSNNKHVFSMDNKDIYGEETYSMSFKEAIENKERIICDYKIITLSIKKSFIENLINSNKFIELKKINKNVSAREFASLLALRKEITNLNLNKIISFHSKKERAEQFSQDQTFINKNYKNLKYLENYHVTGDMPVSKRNNQMKGFKENDSIITNARCLTEGVDVPAVDCVAFIDPKKSTVDIVQASGRAMRKSKKKKFGYIFIPLIIPEDEKLETLKEDSSFKQVVSIVSSLASSDARIVDHLRAVSSGRKYKGGSPIDGLTSKKIFEKIDANEFEKAIKTEIWRRIRNRAIPDLNDDQIKQWIIEHKKITNEFPDSFSGKVKTATNEDWGLINTCFAQGRRGLEGGRSLGKFIFENFRKSDYLDDKNIKSDHYITEYFKLTGFIKFVKDGHIKSVGKIIGNHGRLIDGYNIKHIPDALKKQNITIFFKNSPHENLKELGIKLLDRKNYLTQDECHKFMKKTAWRYIENGELKVVGFGYTKGGVSKFVLKKDVEKIAKQEKANSSLLTPNEIKKKFKIWHVKKLVLNKKLKPDGSYKMGKSTVYLFKFETLKKFKKKLKKGRPFN